MPATLRTDVPVAFRATKNLEDIMLPVNYQSWATKILSFVGVDIPVNRSFDSYQNLDNFKSCHSCSFQSYLTPERHYSSHELSELTM